MATLISCPKCHHKIKVAPATMGKSVKCSCGNVFKAIEKSEPSPTAGTETLLVNCDACGTRLKVPVSARGRKMKCSKCAATFLVGASDAAADPPPLFVDAHWTTNPGPSRSRVDPCVLSFSLR